MTWVQTYTGRAFSLLEPRAADVSLDDIAHHLSAIRRFNGAPALHYSNAQHSILVASLMFQQARSMGVAIYGLLHDAHEAYMGDLISPTRATLKALIGPNVGSVLKQLAASIDAVIYEAFNVPAPDPQLLALVSEADRRALYIERGQHLRNPPKPWPGETTSYAASYADAAGTAEVAWNRNVMLAGEAEEAFKLSVRLWQEELIPEELAPAQLLLPLTPPHRLAYFMVRWAFQQYSTDEGAPAELLP